MSKLEISAKQFGMFRILFGSFLALFFLTIIPYSEMLFSSEGLYTATNGMVSPNTPISISIFAYFNSSSEITAILGVLVFVSILFTLGIFRRTTSLILWYGFISLIHRNFYIADVSTNYIGWMLLLCATIPPGEAFCVKGNKDSKWTFPPVLLVGTWIIFATGYSLSGYVKLSYGHWVSGEALAFIIQSPLGTENLLSQAFLNFKFLSYPLTWLSLYAELLCVILCLHPKSRMLAWVVLTGMQFGILVLMGIKPISITMLLFHLLVFDQRWLKTSK